MKQLILGGARSGKSHFAQQRAMDTGLPVSYLATAEAGDSEMQQRIARHRADRPTSWAVLEEPLYLARALETHAHEGQCVLVDCLTLWLSNLLQAGDDILYEQTVALLQVLPWLRGEVILVSNEVGQGIVPENPLARRFRDEAGRLHQQLAGQCDYVAMVVAGLPMVLKQE